jgi:hypothetical protein
MPLADRFFPDVEIVQPDPNNSIHRSYQHFVAYFQDRQAITEHDFIIACYFTYGWMPTMLDLRGELAESIEIANRVKSEGYIPTAEEIQRLASNINGSVVGTSKVLHFIRPDIHAIWDSRVYRYLHQQRPYIYRLEAPDAYTGYLTSITELTQDRRFADALQNFNRALGYTVTPNRFIEYVMYHHGAE